MTETDLLPVKDIKEIEPRAKMLFLNVYPDKEPHISAAQKMFGLDQKSIEDFKQMALSNISTPPKEEGVKLSQRESKSDIFLPNDPSEFAGIVIMGTPFTAMARKTEDGKLLVAFWKDNLMKFIHSAYEKKVPILGICFGSQVVAEALGGKVEKMQNKWEVGFSTAERTSGSYGDPVMEGLPDQFVVSQNHTDTVVRMPPGAVSLAENPKYGLEAYRIGNVWGFQFHPERSKEEVLEYLDSRSEDLTEVGKNVEENKALGKSYDENLGNIFSNFLKVAWLGVQ
jgi:GMP synthase (glutamine-hydrolysing)